ncbi:hypothetical protein DFH28DRAFT_905685 [Melampsora americana]|nr:hypothetical protein DFH28DRAFT_905685 [Melampsora americana]
MRNETPSTLPFNDRPYLANGIVTPSLHSILSSSAPALERPSSSQSSALTSINPHINPSIFEASRSSQSTTYAPTPATTLAGTSPVKRRSIHLDSSGSADVDFDEDLDRTLLSSLPDEVRTFHVYFNIWQEQVPTAEPGKRQKRTAGGTRPSLQKRKTTKFANYAPKLPTKLTLAPKFYSFANFKRSLFTSCDEKLAGVSDALHRAWVNRRLSIQVFVNGSALHKAINKITITNPANFREFIVAALTAPANTTMGCRILHEDPRKADLAIRALLTVGKSNGNSSDSEESEGHETDHSSVILSAGEKNLRTLMKQFEKDFKGGENVTSVTNPKDPSKILLLNTSRIRDWANDWADGIRGVDEVNPPMTRPGFRWINAADYEKAKAELLGLTPTPTHASNTANGTVIHHNYYGQPFPAVPAPYPGLPNGPAPALRAEIAGSDSMRLSPPPGEVPSFEAFLVFAGIKPEMQKTRNALATEGISDFYRLLDRSTYTLATFRSMGIPFAHAEDLWKAVPKFIGHLRSTYSEGP